MQLASHPLKHQTSESKLDTLSSFCLKNGEIHGQSEL